MNTDDKVTFDPGFSQFSVKIPPEIHLILDKIKNLKQLHQKKFEFQKLEMQLIPLIKICASIYLGCLLWGSYLYYRYKDNPKEIYGNSVKESGSENDCAKEIDFILEIIDKMDKAGNYYLKRPFKIDKNLIVYFKTYREFAVQIDKAMEGVIE